MARMRLLPGEKELVRLRPAPGAWLGRYLLALLWLAWGLLVFDPIHFNPATTRATEILWTIATVGIPIVVVAIVYAARRRWVRFGLGVAGSLVAVPPLFVSDSFAGFLGACLFAAVAALAFALAEIDRRMRTYHLTNLRMLHNGGLWDNAGWTVHYDAVLDVDARQSPVGRLFGYGQLEPVLQRPKTIAPPTKRRKIAVPSMSDIDVSAPPRLDGVGPFARVRHLVACFIQDATATPFLKTEQDTARRVSDAIRALGGSNLLGR